jgi:hypothetical protein
MSIQEVGEGADVDVVAEVVEILEDDVNGFGVLSSLSCVTMQYDRKPCHGLQSTPSEGFHLWNCSGVML